MKASGLDMTAYWLTVIGAINWGLVGAANINVVEYLGALGAKIVYIVIGLAGLWALYTMLKKK